MAQSLQDEVAAGKMTLAEAQAQFRQRGRQMKFDKGQGYPVVYNADTSLVLNGANPQLEGKITGAKDSNDVVIADAQLAAGQEQPRRRRRLLSLSPPRPDRAGSQDGLCPHLCAVERRS